MSFDHYVRHQLAQQRQEGFDVLLRVDELDAKRHVLGSVNSSLLGMHAMMRSEACLGTQYGCASDALFEQQRNNLTAQIVALRTGVFVQMNRDFFRRAEGEHAHRSLLEATVYIYPAQARETTEDFLKFS